MCPYFVVHGSSMFVNLLLGMLALKMGARNKEISFHKMKKREVTYLHNFDPLKALREHKHACAALRRAPLAT